MSHPPAKPLSITEYQRNELFAISRHRGTPQSIALRLKIVLGAAQGLANKALARQLSTTLPTVLLWRRRYGEAGLSGILWDQPRSGRPKRISQEKEAAIVEVTMKTKPATTTHWSLRVMAKAQRVSRSTVHRIWKKHKLQPHRLGSFKFSTDPEFVPKLRDIVGLYLNPPDKAIVLSVDEKSQIQALDRTQPILPLRPGLPERQTHDYERHGTTTLFAALNVLDGTVIGQCQPRHRHQEFLLFLERIEAAVRPRLEVHVVLDNYGTHKHPAVRQWFSNHPRYYVHFTPTGASWLNQIERWFAEITRRRIRRGTFRSVQELIQAIREYIQENNKHPQPFQWVAKSSAIVKKLNRLKREQDDQLNDQPHRHPRPKL